jgi:hypothetical protein
MKASAAVIGRMIGQIGEPCAIGIDDVNFEVAIALRGEGDFACWHFATAAATAVAVAT